MNPTARSEYPQRVRQMKTHSATQQMPAQIIEIFSGVRVIFIPKAANTSCMNGKCALGNVLASLLFGILYQGGSELAFEISSITREMVVAIQGLVILFSGALAYMTTPWVERLYVKITRKTAVPSGEVS